MAVEKVPKQILGRDAKKSDLIEYATINDLILGKGQVTPENHPLIVVRGFFYRLIRQTGKDEDQTPRSSKGLGTPWPPW